MSTKYPIILVHGLILKDHSFFKAFGNIEGFLRSKGFKVYTATADGVGSIEGNARQLKRQIIRVLRQTGAKKVNLIAHSKGGLDSRYMIERLGMGKYVSSLTFLCTPHLGSEIATRMYSLPKPIRSTIAAGINLWYRLIGDSHPDILTACRQLRSQKSGVLQDGFCYDGIYLQSYSAVLEKSKNDFIMAIPHAFSKRYESSPSDGLVSEESCKFGEYKGRCLDEPISHTQIVDLLVQRRKRQKVMLFYLRLCRELSEKGF